MTPHFVVDASVAVAWVHPAQATAESQALLADLEHGAVVEVPAIWPLEVANALLVLRRRKRLTDPERRRALTALHELRLQVDMDAVGFALTKLSALAAEHDLSVYDAAYLELAIRKKLPLACKDGPLRKAGRRCGLTLLLSAG